MFDLRRKAIFAALSLAAFAFPAHSAEFNAAQKAEIEAIVHSYLVEHPEVLREVSVELEKRQKVEEADLRGHAIADNKQALFNSPFQAVVGNPKGKITLVEFFDYNCGYCKKTLGDVARLIKEYPDLRVILKDYPILSEKSVEAAGIALALRKQFSDAKFWEFHQRLLSMRGPVGRDEALGVAKDLGADMDRLVKDAAAPEIKKGLEENDKLGQQLALNGTPSFILGDEAIVGAVGYDAMRGKLDNLKKCGKVACS